jgi:hypothetical protein
VPLEDIQRLAGHADPRTTRLYDRRQKKITRNIVERISILRGQLYDNQGNEAGTAGCAPHGETVVTHRFRGDLVQLRNRVCLRVRVRCQHLDRSR